MSDDAVALLLDIHRSARHLPAVADLSSRQTATLPEPNGAALAPVSDGDALPVRAAARAAGMSESSVRRLIADGLVTAVRDAGGSLRLTQSTIVELRSGGGRTRGPSIGVRTAEAARGEIAAQAFELFEGGAQLVEVVHKLRQDPDVVERLWARWVALQDIQRKTILLSCMFEHHPTVRCNGRPMAQVSLCDAHASRVRVLSEQDSVTLSMLRRGETPMAVACAACGNAIESGTCAKCSAAPISFSISEDGWLRVLAGKREVTRLSRAQLVSFAKSLDPQPEPEATPVETVPAAGGVVPLGEELDALLARIQTRMETP